MRGAAMALVVVAVASAGHAAARVLSRTSSIKTAHFEELRARIAALRAREGLPPVRWTDAVLIPGATTVRRTHLAELRAARATPGAMLDTLAIAGS